MVAQAFLYTGSLDVKLMNQGACQLLLHNDFECFSKVKTEVSNFRCTLFESQWLEEDSQLIFRIRADRFLRNMVRAVVGTLMELGKHKIDLKELERILQSHDRRLAGMSVPAQGLSLVEIKYPDSIFRTKPELFSKDCPEEVKGHDATDT